MGGGLYVGEGVPIFLRILNSKEFFMPKDMKIIQLIQLHDFHHGENDTADSTAPFLFHSEEAYWGRSAQASPELKKKDAVESAASFSPWVKLCSWIKKRIFYFFILKCGMRLPKF